MLATICVRKKNEIAPGGIAKSIDRVWKRENILNIK